VLDHSKAIALDRIVEMQTERTNICLRDSTLLIVRIVLKLARTHLQEERIPLDQEDISVELAEIQNVVTSKAALMASQILQIASD